MRHLVFIGITFGFLAFTCSSKRNEHPQKFVFDEEHVFAQQEEHQLDTLFRGHELRTTNEIALVTTSSYQGKPDLATYAATCGDSLGVGKKGKNNGVVNCFSKHLRQVYIATGLGTEKVLTDVDCQFIIDSLMLPRFKQDQYFQGVLDGSQAVVRMLEMPGHVIK